MQFIDLTGETFGRRTVLGRDPGNERNWICECTCGSVDSVAGSNLHKGIARMCYECSVLENRTEPPDDALSINEANGSMHIAAATISAMIAAGKIHSWPKNNSILVSASEIRRIQKNSSTRGSRRPSNPPPVDGMPMKDLARELGVDDGILRTWFDWPIHPALGRKAESGVGTYTITTSDGRVREHRGLLFSLADGKVCAEARTKPFHRQFPGNSGVWIVDGIFRENDPKGSLWFTEKYAHALFGLSDRTLCNPCYRMKLDSKRVTFPQTGSRDRWKLLVHSEESLRRLAGWKKGEDDGGRWIKRGEIWGDNEGTWYSSKFIAESTGESIREMSRFLRDSGLVTRFKTVPSGNKSGGRSAIVHHEFEVRPILGVPSTLATPGKGPMALGNGGLIADHVTVIARKAVKLEGLQMDSPTPKSEQPLARLKVLNEAMKKALAFIQEKGPVVASEITRSAEVDEGRIRKWCMKNGHLHLHGVRNHNNKDGYFYDRSKDLSLA